MNHHQMHSDPEAGQRDARAERMTQDEAQSVVALWAERQRLQEGVSTLPTVADVAEGLGTTAGETRDLLEEVRARALTALHTAKPERRLPRVRQTPAMSRLKWFPRWRLAAAALSLYLLSPIPAQFALTHFANRHLSAADAFYAPLGWLDRHTPLKVPLDAYGQFIDHL